MRPIRWLTTAEGTTSRHALTVGALALALVVLLHLLPPMAPIPASIYLPLHTFLETFAICVAVLIFAVGWHAFAREPSTMTLALSCGFLAVALFDFGHMFGYSGMPGWVTPSGPEKGINFWLAGRYAAALTLLVAVLAPWDRSVTERAGLGVLALVLAGTALMFLVLLYFPERIPRTFDPETGLTRFKIISEYLIILLNLAAAVFIWRWRHAMQGVDGYSLFTAALLLAISELPFTWYLSITDLNNLAGHLLKVTAYLYLYKALVYARIQRPYDELARTRDRLRATLDALPDMVMEIDARGVVHDYHSSQSALRLHPEALLGRSLYELLPAEPMNAWERAQAEVDEQGSSIGAQYSLDTPQGNRWYEISATGLPVEDPQSPRRYLALLRDVTQRKLQEAELRIAATAFQSQEGIAIADQDMRILRANVAFSETTGVALDKLAGRNPFEFFVSEHDSNHVTRIRSALAAAGEWHGELWWQSAEGQAWPMRVSITAVCNDNGQNLNYVFDLLNLSELKHAEDTIDRLARYDALTGLPNRRQMVERLEAFFEQPAASGRRQYCGLLHIDLDDFKHINETAGFEAGDKILVEVAARLSALEDHGAQVTRHSADEFFVVTDPLGTDEHAAVKAVHELALEIGEWLRRPYRVRGTKVVLGVSIGCVVFDSPDGGSGELLRRADFALNQAKADPHASIAFYDADMQQLVTARASLVQDLRVAIERGELHLQYQPQVNAAGQVVGAEALLRWQSPTNGLVPPTQFIPLAEQNGLMDQLEAWVLAEATRQLGEWRQSPAMRHLYLGVNVSSGEVHRSGFVERLEHLLEQHAIVPGSLMLEFTEGTLIQDFEHVREIVDLLRQRGVRFAIDDFGTGYSSLSYLSRLQVDQIKIDQSFLSHLETSTSDAALVRTIIELSRIFELEVIAEGVETEAQRLFLERHGCLLYQGFLFGRPMSAAAFAAQFDRRD